MKLSEPKVITFWIALILGLVGIIVQVAELGAYGFWLLVIGFVLLVAGNLVKGL